MDIRISDGSAAELLISREDDGAIFFTVWEGEKKQIDFQINSDEWELLKSFIDQQAPKGVDDEAA